jgi:hypothetical protein
MDYLPHAMRKPIFPVLFALCIVSAFCGAFGFLESIESLFKVPNVLINMIKGAVISLLVYTVVMWGFFTDSDNIAYINAVIYLVLIERLIFNFTSVFTNLAKDNINKIIFTAIFKDIFFGTFGGFINYFFAKPDMKDWNISYILMIIRTIFMQIFGQISNNYLE